MELVSESQFWQVKVRCVVLSSLHKGHAFCVEKEGREKSQCSVGHLIPSQAWMGGRIPPSGPFAPGYPMYSRS